MNIRFVAPAVAALASFAFAAESSASAKKGSSTGQGLTSTASKSGTLVAMSGSGSLGKSSESKSYVGMSILPFQYIGWKTTQKNTTVETPETTIQTMPSALDFYSDFGAWVVRPSLSLAANVPSTVGLDYQLSNNLEVGGFLSYLRGTAKAFEKQESVNSEVIVGPQAFFYAEAAGYPVEADARLGIIMKTSETTKEGTTTKTRDISGYAVEANAKITRELSSGLEYYAGVGLGYTSETDKSNKDLETTRSGLVFGIIPAGLRFNF